MKSTTGKQIPFTLQNTPTSVWAGPMITLEKFEQQFEDALVRKLVGEKGEVCPTCFIWHMVQDNKGSLNWCDDPFHNK